MKCVYVNVDGDAKTVELDSDKNEIAQFLGGAALAFAGAWDDCEIVALQLVASQSSHLPENTFTLPDQQQRQLGNGGIVFVKMDQNINPVDFDLRDYRARFFHSNVASP